MNELEQAIAGEVARNLRLFVVGALVCLGAYLGASYLRQGCGCGELGDPDLMFDKMFDALERRELLRDEARRDAPPEV